MARLGENAPSAHGKRWKQAIPAYLAGMDGDFNRRYNDLRNGLIGTAVECRRNIITVDRVVLWAIPERDVQASLPNSNHTPELRVLIEQARQYEIFKEAAQQARAAMEKYGDAMVSQPLDPEVLSRLGGYLEQARQQRIQAEKEASKLLTDLRETSIRLKTLSITALKHAEVALRGLHALAQDLIKHKENMEAKRESENKRIRDLSDEELEAELVRKGIEANGDPDPA